jgi:hypothetical protein
MEKLRSATSEKVVALVSSVGFVGIDVHVHHLINAAGGKEPYLTKKLDGDLGSLKTKILWTIMIFYSPTK